MARINPLYNIYDSVAELLEEEPNTRNSDELLIIRFYEKALGKDLPELRRVLLNDKLARPSSITRARRKAQEIRADLESEGHVKGRRREKENEFIEFARNK